MIPYEDACERTMKSIRLLDPETVDFTNGLGRVLAQDVVSDVDMPGFNKSAMDGFACRRQDLPGPLDVVEEIPAGQVPRRCVGPGQCARIMTGAPVPEGADCVILIEESRPAAPGRVQFVGTQTGSNICRQAEDVRRGEKVAQQGDLITPARVAMLASAGCVRPRVYRRPRVGVIATGSELVEPDVSPSGAAVRNSNSYQLCAQLAAMGAEPAYHGIGRDDDRVLCDLIEKAKAASDVVLVSGGVSMGDCDRVPDCLKACGFRLAVESIAMQPGRPTIFGDDGRVYCWGLPGNPVATFVVFELLMKPFLYGLMGHCYHPLVVPCRLKTAIRRRCPKRQGTVPVRFAAPGVASPLEYHGAGHIHAISGADGLVTVPVGIRDLPEGSVVHVRSI
jgi:molybdopterin molybdotransferase